MPSSPNTYVPDVSMLSAGLGSQATTATSVAMAHQVQAQQAQVQAQVQAAQAAQVASQVAAASSGSPALAAKPKRRRRADGSGNLTVEQKRRICEKHRNTPKITQKDLCRWAKLEFNLQRAPTQPTMSNILKHEHMFKDNVLGVLGSQRKTIRPTRHAHFDQIQAMSWIVDAWQQTSKETIVNAWKPLGITAPFSLDSSMEADDKNVEEELWGLLYCLQLSGIVNTKVLVNSRWENDIHKRLNEDMIEDPKENDEEFRVPNAAPVERSRVGGAHLSANNEQQSGVTAKEQLKSFRDVIRYLERTGSADSRDPQLMNVVEFLKKKQLSLRFDNASNTTLTI
ncbi:hypothetical protein Pcac1_g9895 [Phytophthora cactorum]|nr:hypothetical protein Pcac1_g9895 [Phytophthora cactorum]